MKTLVRTGFAIVTALVATAFLAPSAEAGGLFKKFKCAPVAAPCPPPAPKAFCFKPICAPAPAPVACAAPAPAPCPQTVTACPQTAAPAPCPQTATACPQTPAPCPQTPVVYQAAPCPPPAPKTGCCLKLFSFKSFCGKAAPAPVSYTYVNAGQGCCK